jgi:hypothetical protein
MFSVITLTTQKSGTTTVPFSVSYSDTPKLFVGIFKMAATPGDVLDFMMTTGNLTATNFRVNYTIAAATNISILSMYSLSFVNSSATSFLSVNHHVKLTTCNPLLMK